MPGVATLPAVPGASILHPSPKDGTKAIVLGTHRAFDVETTWKRAEVVLPRMGVTRVADVTMLDEIGIPVWQAVRPNGTIISVSQGKGVSHDLARVSAVMEAIEHWHAEQEVSIATTDSAANLRNEITYDTSRLGLAQGSLFTDTRPVAWVTAIDLVTGKGTLAPRDAVFLSDLKPPDLSGPMFALSTNGLASGNTQDEAVLHGLLELIERDLVAAAGKERRNQNPSALLAIDSVDGPCSVMLIEALKSADVLVRITNCSVSNVACFAASIWSPTFPFVFNGFGCHFDRDVALSRALTEAVQSRLTAISGTRDDLPMSVYRDLQRDHVSVPPWSVDTTKSAVKFNEVFSRLRPSIPEDIDAALSVVRARGGENPVVVDLSNQEIGIPVVRVFAPGLVKGH
ncbi:YcaO-like family protein [Streptomyces sp. NPDC099088]|uniref:YcaO-like family protein n=1 Tax=Streptomyces sp. NPDC099088 TaxID=3366101 RepID=UPI0037FC4225